MDQYLPVIFIGIVAVAFIGGSLLVAAQVDRRRTAEYTAWCQARHLRFDHELRDEDLKFAEICPLFTLGRSHYWGYSISGECDGVPYTMFEYRYTTGSGRGGHTNITSAIAWRTEREFPQFSLTPERFVDRMAAFLGGQDIDFHDSPEFSRARRLRGTSESAVRALFTPRLREAMTSIGEEGVAGGRHHLFWWRLGQLPSPQDLDQFLADGERIRLEFEKSA